VADPEISKGTEKHVSITSSFIANAHNELCFLYANRQLIQVI